MLVDLAGFDHGAWRKALRASVNADIEAAPAISKLEKAIVPEMPATVQNDSRTL